MIQLPSAPASHHLHFLHISQNKNDLEMNILLKNLLWCSMKTDINLYVQGNYFIFESRQNWKQHWSFNNSMPIWRNWSTISSPHMALFILMFFIWQYCHTHHWRRRDDIANYVSDILWKNLNVLVYAKMVKSGVYHDIRTMILALDHPTCVALPFFYAFSGCDTVQLLF